MTRITIDPITRLEGHATIEIHLDDRCHVERTFFQVHEPHGFEQLVLGRQAEDMPQITSRICGACPMAHHLAATKALDALYHVEPPPAARAIRELAQTASVVDDHAFHLYFLAGPDFGVGLDTLPSDRNAIGAVAKLGVQFGDNVIAMRRRLRDLIATVAGKATHPVFGLPGGVARRVTAGEQEQFRAVAREALEFSQSTLDVFRRVVLCNSGYVDLIRSDAFTQRTCYMGQVDPGGRVNFYDGRLRVVKPDGAEWASFEPAAYPEYIAEHVEPWSFGKFCYLKPVGWRGFVEGDDNGVYCVGPLARLNASTGFTTPLAQAACDEFHATLGGRPVHHTLANHWARVIEMLYASERMEALANDDALTDPRVRTLPTDRPTEGVGVVEAPRGTLIHHYRTDARGIIERANLVVATDQG